MTVSSQLNRVQYAGDGVTTVFSTSPVVFFDSGDLDVYIVVTSTGTATLKTITTHYAVSGGSGAVGTVTMTAPVAVGTNLLILRVMPITQESDFVNNDPSDAEVAEDSLDKLTMISQQLDEALGRAVLLGVGSAATGIAIPDPAALKLLRWDATATALENVLVASATTLAFTVTAFAETLLDDSTATAARATLSAQQDVITTKGDIIVGSASSVAARKAAGANGTVLIPNSGNTDGLVYLANMLGNVAILGGHLVASVAASALTVSVKTAAGNDPSATEPVYFFFRNATETDGTSSYIAVTAALTLAVSSGSTLGTANDIPHRLWVVAFNDAGTPRLGVMNTQLAAGVGGIAALSDDILASSTAEGGGGAADSAGVLYSGTAVTAKATRVLGYVESTQATAGTWATAPSKIHQYTVGGKLPGDTVQMVWGYSVSGSSTTSTTYVDVTNGGTTITITSAVNKVLASFFCEQMGVVGVANGATGFLRLVRTATVLSTDRRVFQNDGGGSAGGNIIGLNGFDHLDSPGAAGATVYKLQHHMTASEGGSIVVKMSKRLTEVMA